MYLLLTVCSVIALIIQDWRIGIPIAVIVFCMDRVTDSYRNELDTRLAKLAKKLCEND